MFLKKRWLAVASFANNRAGKCVPCRIGAQKITQMGQRLVDGQVTAQELPALCQNIVELSDVMQATSICGLDKSRPIRSALSWPIFLIAWSKRWPQSQPTTNAPAGSATQSLDSEGPEALDAHLPTMEECGIMNSNLPRLSLSQLAPMPRAEDEPLFARDVGGRLIACRVPQPATLKPSSI